jgi:hypothetical protein
LVDNLKTFVTVIIIKKKKKKIADGQPTGNIIAGGQPFGHLPMR